MMSQYVDPFPLLGDNFEMVKFLMKDHIINEFDIYLATANGNLDILKFISAGMPIKNKIMEIACRHGHLHIIKWVYALGEISEFKIYYTPCITVEIAIWLRDHKLLPNNLLYDAAWYCQNIPF